MTHVLKLDDWQVWQTAARLSHVTITERCRVIAAMAAESGVQPAGMTPAQIIEWLHSHPEWSDSTAATYQSYVGAWFKWLQLVDHRPDNPMVKVGTAHYPDREPRPISDEDMARHMGARMWRSTRIMILLAALAGLRVSEIARVRGEDVDLGARLIWVKGKGRKLRSIPLHPILVEVASTMPVKGWWFPMRGTPGAPMHGKSVSDVVGRTMRRAGVNATPHALRHWYATTLLANGADLRTVQELLRHKSLATTQVYTKVSDERRRQAVDDLDPLRWRTPAGRVDLVGDVLG